MTKTTLKQKERIAATTEACANCTPPATYAAVAAHAARNSNRRQGKQKRVNKEQNKTNKNELLASTIKAVTEPPALAVQSETTMGGESVDSVVSSNVSKPKQFEKVSGARKVLGTMRETQSCDRGYFQIVPTNNRTQNKTQDSDWESWPQT